MIALIRKSGTAIWMIFNHQNFIYPLPGKGKHSGHRNNDKRRNNIRRREYQAYDRRQADSYLVHHIHLSNHDWTNAQE